MATWGTDDRRRRALPLGVGRIDVLAAAALSPFVLFDSAIGIGAGGIAVLAVPVSLAALVAVLLRARHAAAGVLVVSTASVALSVVGVATDARLSLEAAVPLALAYLLIAVVRRATPPLAIGASVLAVATVAISAVARVGTVAPAILFVLLLWVPVGVGIAIGLYQRWVDAAHRQAADLARQAERLAIARELHDVVAHHVTGIVVSAQAAQLVADRDPGAAHAALHDIEVAGTEALASMRSMVGSLRGNDPAPSAPTATVADIADLVEQTRRAGYPVAAAIEIGPDDHLTDAVSVATYRIVQESLSNVRRHAEPGASVTVQVATREGGVDVSVADGGPPRRHRLVANGRATGDWTADGFGLIGMAERVAALGGRLDAGPAPAPAGGWRVHALLPLDPGGAP